MFTATNAIPVNLDFHTDVSTAAGYIGIDWGSVNAPSTTQALSSTTISNTINPVAITSNTKINQALNNFTFLMTSSTTHAPQTGLTITATRSLNGGAFAPCANSVSEIGFGWYQINLASTDMNANTVSLRFTATGADDRDIQIVTQP